MAFLFADSFDHYVTADILKKWTSLTGGVNPITSIGAFGRRGTNGLKLSHAGNQWQTNAINITPVHPVPSGATCITGFAWATFDALANFDTSTSEGGDQACIFAVLTGTTVQCWFRINQNGTISAYRGTTLLGTSAQYVPYGGFSFLEFKVVLSTTVGTIQVRFNGVLDTGLNLSGINNASAGTAVWDTARYGPFGSTNYATADVRIDDLWLADGSGSNWNDFMGEIVATPMFPNADGFHSDFTRSTGATQYGTIDETTQNGDTDYNSSAVAGAIDTLNFAAMSPSGAPIKGVQLLVLAKKGDAGASAHKAMTRIAGVDYEGTEYGMYDSYFPMRQQWGVSPATGIPWTEAEFNAAEFGYKKSQ